MRGINCCFCICSKKFWQSMFAAFRPGADPEVLFENFRLELAVGFLPELHWTWWGKVFRLVFKTERLFACHLKVSLGASILILLLLSSVFLSLSIYLFFCAFLRSVKFSTASCHRSFDMHPNACTVVQRSAKLFRCSTYSGFVNVPTSAGSGNLAWQFTILAV